MASSRDRQRKLARAKLDRQMARRAVKERRKRRLLAGAGAVVAVLVIVAGVAWMGGAFDSDEPSTDAADQDICLWTPQNASTNSNLKDVGTPPTKDIPTLGTETMTVTTNQGEPIVVGLDRELSPCGTADISYLASKQFYDNTDCHEITSYGALRCGDPSGTGLGGPTYSVYNENVPTAPEPSASAGADAGAKTPLYPKGTVALIGDPPGTNGSQFLIFFKDYSPATAEYSIVGKVTGGQATLDKIAKIPTSANDAGEKVKPTQKITIKTLTVGDAPASAAPSASTQS
ncbi:peptidylprolyl isomerase [Paractinoplanes brasiliensis]|uniref:Peptidyl-prolyl cis-trans isomerase B (Cyclophilin B) n=1 Tax=Paractinoplanes brasiliensis TaxID=52695 RepID=A0A4R6K044_9ACTN|nr:peptidylprolyl isomerase [Actinoplanes brasiliensis]TDO41562.1 peptidyl-prolyl cis-trans isomerase B (cyclophilin B) [Actinoplanes brasiliensis]GID27150.1 peptidyl-prolyl cis-trans isomerase (rotamase) [Actinoplanes brasiliensis]